MLMNSLLSAVALGKRAFGILLMVLIIAVLGVQNAVTAPPVHQSFLRKNIIATDLPLYKLIRCIDENIKTQLKEVGEDNGGSESEEVQRTLLSAVSLSETARELIEGIVKDFNENRAPLNREIEQRFLKICTLNKEVDAQETKQRHLRELVKYIKSFNSYITFQCSRSKFLKESDKEFYHRLTQLNQILLYGILNEDYIDIDLLDHAADLLVYRPLEFMARHKVWTAIIVTAVVAGLAFYYWKRWKSYLPRHRVFDLNGTEVVYYNTLEQKGATCPVHSCVNGTAFRFGNNKEEKKKLIDRIRKHPEIFQAGENYILTKKREKLNTLIQNINTNGQDFDAQAAKSVLECGGIKDLRNLSEKQIFDTLDRVEKVVDSIAIVANHEHNVSKIDNNIKKVHDALQENLHDQKNSEELKKLKVQLDEKKRLLQVKHQKATEQISNNQQIIKNLENKNVQTIATSAEMLNTKYKVTTEWMQAENFQEFVDDPGFIAVVKNELVKYDNDDNVNVATRNPNPICILDVGGDFNRINSENAPNEIPQVCNDVKRFRDDTHAQSNIILRCGGRSDNGHWIAVSLERDTKNNNPVVLVADSFGAGQRKTAPAFEVGETLSFYTNPNRLTIKDEIDIICENKIDLIGNIIDNQVEPQNKEDKPAWQPINRAPRVLGILADVCSCLVTNEKDIQNDQKPLDTFNRIKQFCDMHEVKKMRIPLAGPNGVNNSHEPKKFVELDIDATNYQQFVEWVQNNNLEEN